LLKSVRAQAELAIEEADVILFVVDLRTGITGDDEEVARMLYRSGKPVVLAVNKVDNLEMAAEIYDFYRLGFGDPYGVSGAHGTGFGDLLDAVVDRLPEAEEDDYG